MDFAWTDEQTEFRSVIGEFAASELNEGFVERERKGEFNREGWTRCAEMGIHGLPVSREYGGLDRDALTTVGVLEKLGYGCKDNGLCFSINAHMWTCEMPLVNFGTEEQKRRYLPGLVNGELIGGNAMSEPGSGSDAYSLQTTATKKGDRYLLDGTKIFVTNGPVADVFLVYAKTDRAKDSKAVSAFLVERDTPGLSVSRGVSKMGLNTSPMAELYFEDCEISEEQRLGREGAGQSLFADSMTWERGCILASAVGTMERLIETCVRYARDREQFGQSIGKFQLVSTKIVDMKLRLETARSLLYQAAWKSSGRGSAVMEAAMAKLWISENWVRTAEDAMQIHGGYGYMKEYEFERELRDAMGSRLYSGTSEIQRVIIAGMMGL